MWRTMVQAFDLATISKGQASGSLDLTLELYDLGLPVDVEAPPASQSGDGDGEFG